VALLKKYTLVKPLVQDGVVVTPVKIRHVPTTSSSLTQGTTTRTMPVQEIVLAVAPQEVALLAQAMDLKYEITCVARSGRPASLPPASEKVAPSPGPRPGHTGGAASQVFAALAKAVLSAESTAAPDKATPAPGRAKTGNPTKSETPGNRPATMDITPGLDPLAETRYMEVMIGTQRQFVLFTGPGNSPVVASQDDGSAKAGSAGVPEGAVEERKQ
jgi:hypothetical protein